MKKNNKGFTLAEMLIVVAIIGVLIAILIPTFTTQLKKARAATDAANIRSAYATYCKNVMEDGSSDKVAVELKGNHAWEGISDIGGTKPSSGEVSKGTVYVYENKAGKLNWNTTSGAVTD